MIHLFIIFFLCSICIGLIWSCVGLMDKIKRLEMECDEMNTKLCIYEDRWVEDTKKHAVFEKFLDEKWTRKKSEITCD